MTKESRAFSLTEILIALGIIILFITLPFLAYRNYSKKARDEKRKTDLLKISQGLEQYRAEKGVYPPDLDALKTEGYLPDLPVDPLDGEAVPGEEGIEYGYSYESDGNTYTLMARLEDDVRSSVGGGGGGGLGAGTLTNYNLSGTATGVPNGGAYTGTVSISGTVTAGGVLNGTFSGSLSGGSITGTITNATVSNATNGSVSGTCTFQTGTVAGTSFNGIVVTCNLTGSGGPGGGSGPGVFIVDPINPKGDDKPIAQLTQDAGTSPSPTIPSKTPYISPTDLIRAGSVTVTPPPCTQSITCSGSCRELSGRCAAGVNTYASTMGDCLYYTRPGFPVCQPMPAPDQACTVTSDSCTPATGEHPVCNVTTCIPYCNATISCAGSCQQLNNRCGSYSSTRSGCTYTTHSAGTCQVTAALDQACTVTGDTCNVGGGEHPNCSGTNCIPNCDSTISCSGSCQTTAGRCAPNSYASTRGGCTYTTYSGGGSCTAVAAPNQACSVTSQSCTSPPLCETSTSYCRNCLSNANCTNPAAPRCASYNCSACTGDPDCSNFAGTYCSSGTCTEPSFSTYFGLSNELPGHKGIMPSKVDYSTFVQRVYSSGGNNYAGVYKFDNRGNLSWNAGSGSMSYPTQWVYPRGVQPMADGGVVGVSSVMFDQPNTRHSVYLQMFNSGGGLLQESIIGRPGVYDGDVEFYHFDEIPAAQGGGIIGAGLYTTSSSPYQASCILMRVNTSGNIVWQKLIGSAPMTCTAQSVAYNPTGNNIVFLIIGSSIPGAPGNLDAALLRFDLSGNLQSAWAYGTSAADFIWQQSAGINPSNGHVTFTFGLNSYATNLLMRVNPNTSAGSSIASKLTDYNATDSLTVFSDGGFGITANGSGNAHHMAVFDSAGNKLWEKQLNPFVGGSRTDCNYAFPRKTLNGQYVATARCYGPQFIWKLRSNGSMSSCTDLTDTAIVNSYLWASSASVSINDVTGTIPISNGGASREYPSTSWNYDATRTNNCTY